MQTTVIPMGFLLISSARSLRSLASSHPPSPCSQLKMVAQRYQSTKTTANLDDIEMTSFDTPLPDKTIIQSFDTVSRVQSREAQLPGKRYQYHPPKYDKGPLHPVQSLPHNDPLSRNFMAGPFHIPRLTQTYEHTISSDIMTLAYLHTPPGTSSRKAERQRLRSWDDSSPYHLNRPLRGPRGSTRLPILEKEITYHNIPKIYAIHLNTYVPKTVQNHDYLAIARSVMQSISGRCPRVTWVKTPVAQWKVKAGDIAGCKVSIFGDQAADFLDKVINIVFPKIKDFPGIKGNGDRSGNIAFGLTPADMAHFPEVGINYDMYSSKLLPGMDVYIETTATSDRQARLLLSALGVPFNGKF